MPLQKIISSVREPGIFRHNGGPIKDPLKSIHTYCIDVRGAPQGNPRMPRDASLSDSSFFSSLDHVYNSQPLKPAIKQTDWRTQDLHISILIYSFIFISKLYKNRFLFLVKLKCIWSCYHFSFSSRSKRNLFWLQSKSNIVTFWKNRNKFLCFQK